MKPMKQYPYRKTFAIELDRPGGSITTSKGRNILEAWDHFKECAGSCPDIRRRARTIEACAEGGGYDPKATIYPIRDGELVLP
jgi:hypothetical protein